MVPPINATTLRAMANPSPLLPNALSTELVGLNGSKMYCCLSGATLDACVSDSSSNCDFLSGDGFNGDCQYNAAAGGELYGIIEQVEQNMPESNWIPAHFAG